MIPEFRSEPFTDFSKPENVAAFKAGRKLPMATSWPGRSFHFRKAGTPPADPRARLLVARRE